MFKFRNWISGLWMLPRTWKNCVSPIKIVFFPVKRNIELLHSLWWALVEGNPWEKISLHIVSWYMAQCMRECSAVSDFLWPHGQAALLVEFSRQEYRSGLPFPTPGMWVALSYSGESSRLRDRTLSLWCFLRWQVDSLPLGPRGKACNSNPNLIVLKWGRIWDNFPNKQT